MRLATIRTATGTRAVRLDATSAVETGDADVRAMRADELHALRAKLARPEPTDNLLDRRLAEELTYTQRLLEMAEGELKRRGGSAGVIAQLHEAETVVEDVAGVVEAKDRCAGVERASPEVRRRLTRKAAGEEPVCRS